tara:strand:- start:138 stop:401 length:264 start_codon:yes stop_codon:yes gene_type:complete
MKTLNDFDYKDSDNMTVKMLPKPEVQKMLKELRRANKEAGKTIFAIFKEDMGYSVLAHYPKRGIVRVLNALRFSRYYSVRIDRNLFI